MDLTYWVSDQINDVAFEHDCIHVAASIKKETDPYQIISYCLTEWPSTWNTQENNPNQKLTFAQLYQQNITSQELYLWSAPMDATEQYQLYLNQLAATKDVSSMESQFYYNCTLPKFGPFCQYSFDIDDDLNDLSLNDIIYGYYQQEYDPNNLTCYMHLECIRGSKSMCLDWSEICDGTVDCENGIDEKDCWQLEQNQCDVNSYRCKNGQCISRIFLHDDPDNYECLDKSDEADGKKKQCVTKSIPGEPTFINEDILCPNCYSTYRLELKLTSSCFGKRDKILKQLMLFDKPHSMSDDCWLAVQCELKILRKLDPKCLAHCYNKTCRQIINETCDDMIKIPSSTFVFGHIFFIYIKQMIKDANAWPPPPPQPPQYVCYNDQLCHGLGSSDALISFNNFTCRPPEDFPLTFNNYAIARGDWYNMYIPPLYEQLPQCNPINSHISTICNNITMYKCLNSSKCISKDRICDGVDDCIYKDDEQCSSINGSCLIYGLNNLFKCQTTNTCISSSLVGDGICDCSPITYEFCDDEDSNERYIRTHISFPTICDGFTELVPINIDGQNQTDETECQYWPCNNTYTRCDGFWNCFDGTDEVDCDPSPVITCPIHHHICISPNTSQFICLPLEKANDGIIDCFGGTDEPKLCRSNTYEVSNNNFFCTSYTNEICTTFSNLCYGNCYKDRIIEQLCDDKRNITSYYAICDPYNEIIRYDIEHFFCARKLDSIKPQLVHFALDKLTNSSSNQLSGDNTDEIISLRTSFQYQQTCHRGLPVRIRSNDNKNLTTLTCLCPPSFYGNMCQYQNQRVSLTLRFQVYSDSRQTSFAFVILLIDDRDERIIHSYKQITYLYIQHCQTKFNMYLLYANRPKFLTNNYSIHIDIYEKISLTYRGSSFIPLNFSFLPVHRIAVLLTIPRTTDNKKSCTDSNCIHGQCVLYTDNPYETSFCKCNQGWSGKYCTIPQQCTCAPGSVCVGIGANNRSICICPINKWGSQCLLNKTICNSNPNTTCQNNGQCIPLDENLIPNQQFICLCQKGFHGRFCEIKDNQILISFNNDIQLPHTILVHFIQINDSGPPINGSTFKTLQLDQKLITIYWSHPFHIVFVELLNDSYYLVTVQKTYNQSSILTKTINPSDRCAHINAVLNETIVTYPLLRRIKYYHIPCQQRSPLLSCFYDDTHFCLCNDFGSQRLANCFEFNSTIKHDCFGQSNCENGASCLQDRPSCPQTSMCICPTCYYGIRCQFTSNLFALSLDGILGYHIQPHINMKSQPSIVQFSITLATILVVVTIINGILSLITFKNKEIQKVGCGFYLLVSSVIVLIIAIMFIMKISILIITQMTYVTNRTFLNIQCYLIDFLLHSCLNIDQWLSACVAMERVFTIAKGVKFNKNKSKQIAKYIIGVGIFLTITTNIHDPIHRRLLDENDHTNEENRIWCIASYSNNLQIYNKFIQTFHFIVPFIINIISAIIIITMTARQQTIIQTQQTYNSLLYEQFQQHKNLLIAPVILILLAIPRLILYFVGGCMKSTRDSWLFLIGYFISFVPSMLTFPVFVLSSTSYKETFLNTMKNYRRKIRIRFGLHL